MFCFVMLKKPLLFSRSVCLTSLLLAAASLPGIQQDRSLFPQILRPKFQEDGGNGEVSFILRITILTNFL